MVKLLSLILTIGSDPNNHLSFCKTAFFPELSNPKAVKDYIEKKI